MPYQGIESEMAVIGSIIMGRDKAFAEALQEVDADDFINPNCANIFDICKNMFLSGEKIDTITVCSKFITAPEHKIFIADCCKLTCAISNVREYSKIVKANSQRTKAIEKVDELKSKLIFDAPMNECEPISMDISRILSDTTQETAVSPIEGMSNVIVSLDKPRRYMPSGMARIDKYLKVDKGDYIIIAGRPSAGKTALSLQMMLKYAETHRVVYFSLETSANKIYDRLVSCYCQFPFETIKKGIRTEEEKKLVKRISASSTEFCKLNFTVVNAAGWTVSKIQSKALELKADIVMIDYISLIKSTGKSKLEEVSNISVDLHIMAQRYNMLVIALSQLNRNNAQGEPNLSDLRESGQLEQDADGVLMVYLKDPSNPDEASRRIIKIAKNKEGETGIIPVNFDGKRQTFHEEVNRD